MPAKENPDTKTRCSRCGAMFTCNPGADCWCTELPELPMPAAPDATCFCPTCLRAVLERN